MSNLLTLVIATPIIYLLLALLLVVTPVKRRRPGKSLDFDALGVSETTETHVRGMYFTARDGSELFYRYIHGDKKIIVVLLHGSGADGRYLIPLASTLNTSSGVSVIIPDLRGHGESALSHMGDVSYLGQLEHDLEDLNNGLRTSHPDSTVILGGHSSGGGLAVKYGGNSLSRFDAYLFLAPYLGYRAPTVRPDSGGWVQVSKRRYAGLAMLNNVGVSALNGVQVLFFNRPPEMKDPLLANAYTYRLNESFSPQAYEENLRANKKPVLTLVGKDDEAFYSDKFPAVFQKNAPHAQVSVLPGTKHLDLPTQPRTAEYIVQWLKTV